MNGESLRLSICSTFTINAQSKKIENSLALNSKLKVEFFFADIDNVETELFDQNSGSNFFNPDAILILWRLEDISPKICFHPHSLSEKEREGIFNNILDRISKIFVSYNGFAKVFISTFPNINQYLDFEGLRFGPKEIINRLNAHIISECAKASSFSLFDFNSWSSSVGETFTDEKYDIFARQAISLNSIDSFATYLGEKLRPLKFPAKKILAVDLDNTLWGGVLGEDLIEGLSIGLDYPGNIYYRIQQHIKDLIKQGVVVILVTKNNHADVKEAFEKLDGKMPLSFADFSKVKANWDLKSKNISDATFELNLGIDSVVFFDDSPFEMQEVRASCPEVSIIEHECNPLSMLRALRKCRLFDKLSTDEDKLRNKDYSQAENREKLLKSSQSHEEFLEKLELKGHLTDVSELTMGRAFQMLTKTNQFNVTTKRHGISDLKNFLADENNVLINLSLEDKFSDQGIIGLAIALKKDSNIAIIDSFLMSCRAIGRGAEDLLWSGLVKKLKTLGYSQVEAEYVPTKKNMQVESLFNRFGLQEDEVTSEASKKYSLDLNSYEIKTPDHIKIIDG